MSERVKHVCVSRRCGWVGYSDEFLRAPHPFIADEEIIGCPKCKSTDSLYVACDVDGCSKTMSSGAPGPNGWQRRCSDHVERHNGTN